MSRGLISPLQQPVTMDTDDQAQSAKSELLLRSTPIFISEISPTKEQLSGCCIRTVISLVWPYSSSTKSLSFLLSERDFRLHNGKGQVKATFHGPAAERVAETRAGIGDEVTLSLEGSTLVENKETTRALGKGIDWDVHFDSRVFLEVTFPSLRI